MALPPDVVELASERLVAPPKHRIILNDDGVTSAIAAVREHFPGEPPDIMHRSDPDGLRSRTRQQGRER